MALFPDILDQLSVSKVLSLGSLLTVALIYTFYLLTLGIWR